MTDRNYNFSGPDGSAVLPGYATGGGLRVMLAGPDALALAGLAGLLADTPELNVVEQVVSEESDAGAMGRAMRLHHPDVVAWDFAAEFTVPEALSLLAAGETPLLALVAGEEAAQAAIAAGARGAVLRSDSAGRIGAAILALSQGLFVLDDRLAEAMLGRVRAGGRSLLAEPLTAREQEVVQLLARGLSNKAIGERLGISEHTVKFHVNSILAKLDAQTRTDAVVRAARLGLILL
ncbi:MAG: response regulator transcription factor [SAR324 cluster bacterium]